VSEDVVSYDKRRGPGHARVDLGRPAPAAPRLVLRRFDGDRKPFLGVAGWQDAPHPIPIDAVSGTAILLGPRVCNLVPGNIEVELALEDDAGTRIWSSGRLFWPEIPRRGRIADDAGPIVGGIGPERMEATIKREPIVEPRREPPEPTTVAGGPGPTDPPPEDEKPELPPPWWSRPAAALTLLSTALVVGAFAALLWFRPTLSCDWFGVLCRPVVLETACTSLPGDADLDPLLDRPAAAIGSALFQPPAAPPLLRQAGLWLLGQSCDPALKPLARAAIYRAAEGGDPDAALWAADANDPSRDDDPAGLGDERDPDLALGMFARLADRGDDAAGDRKRKLCAFLERRRFDGIDRDRIAIENHCRP